MADTGVKYPASGTSVSEAPYDDNAWVNPGNIGADDAAYAQVVHPTFDAPAYSEILTATQFSMGVPAGATIDGIKVEVEAYNDAGEFVTDVVVQLTKDGTTRVGNNKGTSSRLETTPTIRTYGSATDLWGTTWNDTAVNATTFGIHYAAQADSANADVYVDYIRVTVYYTAGGQTFYQNTGQGSMAIASTSAKVTTFYRIIGGASLAISSILSKLTQKTVGGASLTIASILSSTGSFFRTVGDASLAIASSVAKITSKTMGGASMSITGALVKLATKTVGGASLTIASTLSSVRSFSQAVGGATASIAGAIATVYIKVVSVGNASVSIAGALARASTFYRTIGAGAISISSSLTKSIFRSAGQASMAVSGALVKLTGRATGKASISIASALAKKTSLSVGQASASIAGALTRAGTFARTVGGASLNIASSLTASLLGGVIAQAVGGATMAIAGVLSTIFYDIVAVVGKRQRFPTTYDGVKTDALDGYGIPKPKYKFPSSYERG